MASDTAELSVGIGKPALYAGEMSGAAVLVVVGEPVNQLDKDAILKKISDGFLTWDTAQSGCDISAELAEIAATAPAGVAGVNGEHTIRGESTNLHIDVLINPLIETVTEALRVLLLLPTKHKHLIYAGYSFDRTGNWILQDGSFTFADVTAVCMLPDVAAVLQERASNAGSLFLHCTAEGLWQESHMRASLLGRQLHLSSNPQPVVSETSGIIQFVAFVSMFVQPFNANEALQSSTILGSMNFERPTVYAFPAGRGDCALFGINGFNMLVDGGSSRHSCFWPCVRHINCLDVLVMSHIGENNVLGLKSFLEKKATEPTLRPAIGHVYFNASHFSKPDCAQSSSKELSIELAYEASLLAANLQRSKCSTSSCHATASKDSSLTSVNLYHKIGYGSLDMYVLNPSKESASKAGAAVEDASSLAILLLWKPANPNEKVTRVLFPGSTPQSELLKAFEKLKHLECLHPERAKTAGTLAGVKASTAITKKQPPAKLPAAAPKSSAPASSADTPTNDGGSSTPVASHPHATVTVPEEPTATLAAVQQHRSATPSSRSITKSPSPSPPKSPLGDDVLSNSMTGESNTMPAELIDTPVILEDDVQADGEEDAEASAVAWQDDEETKPEALPEPICCGATGTFAESYDMGKRFELGYGGQHEVREHQDNAMSPICHAEPDFGSAVDEAMCEDEDSLAFDNKSGDIVVDYTNSCEDGNVAGDDDEAPAAPEAANNADELAELEAANNADELAELEAANNADEQAEREGIDDADLQREPEATSDTEAEALPVDNNDDDAGELAEPKATGEADVRTEPEALNDPETSAKLESAEVPDNGEAPGDGANADELRDADDAGTNGANIDSPKQLSPFLYEKAPAFDKNGSAGEDGTTPCEGSELEEPVEVLVKTQHLECSPSVTEADDIAESPFTEDLSDAADTDENEEASGSQADNVGYDAEEHAAKIIGNDEEGDGANTPIDSQKADEDDAEDVSKITDAGDLQNSGIMETDKHTGSELFGTSKEDGASREDIHVPALVNEDGSLMDNKVEDVFNDVQSNGEAGIVERLKEEGSDEEESSSSDTSTPMPCGSPVDCGRPTSPDVPEGAEQDSDAMPNEEQVLGAEAGAPEEHAGFNTQSDDDDREAEQVGTFVDTGNQNLTEEGDNTMQKFLDMGTEAEPCFNTQADDDDLETEQVGTSVDTGNENNLTEEGDNAMQKFLDMGTEAEPRSRRHDASSSCSASERSSVRASYCEEDADEVSMVAVSGSAAHIADVMSEAGITENDGDTKPVHDSPSRGGSFDDMPTEDNGKAVSHNTLASDVAELLPGMSPPSINLQLTLGIGSALNSNNQTDMFDPLAEWGAPQHLPSPPSPTPDTAGEIAVPGAAEATFTNVTITNGGGDGSEPQPGSQSKTAKAQKGDGSTPRGSQQKSGPAKKQPISKQLNGGDASRNKPGDAAKEKPNAATLPKSSAATVKPRPASSHTKAGSPAADKVSAPAPKPKSAPPTARAPRSSAPPARSVPEPEAAPAGSKAQAEGNSRKAVKSVPAARPNTAPPARTGKTDKAGSEPPRGGNPATSVPKGGEPSKADAGAPSAAARKSKPAAAPAATKAPTLSAKPSAVKAPSSSSKHASTGIASSKGAHAAQPVVPFSVDLAYLPHHLVKGPGAVDFFRHVQSRYYVLSGMHVAHAAEILDGLLVAKEQWEGGQSCAVTVIPTHDSDGLHHWQALNRDRAAALNVDVAPAASCSSIHLQDDEGAFFAYRQEF